MRFPIRAPLSLPLPFLLSLLFATLTLISASSGDRNPTFQHCLKGCSITYCDPSQPPIPAYLRIAGWDCESNCKYSCMHSFTDNIRSGGRWHQFYGKWPFYRLGPIQEPLSVLFSLGNLYVHYKGLSEVRRRVRRENGMRRWLEVVALGQMNTWVWSAVFHSRDTPTTERLDYFSATLTISLSLLYTLLRVFSLISPSSTSRLAFPVIAGIAFLALSHYTYLLSFPLGSFPYGYHIAFNVGLATVHSLAWILFSASFYIPIPALSFRGRKWTFQPYPPLDPIRSKSTNATTPLALVGLTTLAMSLELLDFPPFFRILDAHALWHAATIPLAAGWWRFLCSDAIDLETAQIGGNMPLTGVGAGGGGLLSASNGTPKTPGMSSGSFPQGNYPSRSKSPGRSPIASTKGDMQE